MKVTKEQGEERGYMCIQSIVESQVERSKKMCAFKALLKVARRRKRTQFPRAHTFTSHT
jgi:hypothetical protein